MSAIRTFTESGRISGEELALRPDIGPCELIEGKIVLMSPTGDEHGRIEGNVFRVVDAFVRAQRLGHVRVGEVGIYTRRNPDSVRAADVLFISTERYARRTVTSGYLDVAPELVVEILSPRDAVIDLAEKVREYFAIGVTLLWIIDPRARRVYAHRSATDVREFLETDRLPGEDVLPGFETVVSTFFAE